MSDSLSGWTEVNRADGIPQLEKLFKFPDWDAAMAFAAQVSQAAGEANHHPELVITWGRVTVRWWSHDERAITDRDRTLAARCDDLARSAG